MERRVLALRNKIKDNCPKKENLDLPKWMRQETLMGLSKHADRETDGSFDTNEMLLDIEKQFMEAAKRDDVKTMKYLAKSVNVNAKNVHNRTALHYAVAGKNKDATQFLLQRRVKVDQKDKFGMAAIHLAAWFGSLEMLKLLVQAGAEQKVENEEGLNIMHCAAINNHTDIVEYIINDMQMKDLDKDDQSGNRPFALAAEHGSLEMLKILMEPYSMATMKPNKRGDTPLHLAARNGHLDAIQLLLQSFDTRDEVNVDGETALYQAADTGQEDCVLALLEAGCDPNILTVAKCSALHTVSEKGDLSLVQLLLEFNAHTDVQNQQLEAPLHLAVKNSHIPVIHSLIVAGCNVNIADKRLQTALHLSAERGSAEVVETLLKAGVDLTPRDRTNPGLNESVYSEHPLTFKLDHRIETKQLRSTAWRLAYELLKPGDWKRLAENWAFTKEQVSAIEDQWTGQQSYKEHGHRMLLIWLHGEELAQRSPSQQLYQELILIGNRKAADKIWVEAENTSRSCCIS
ncbi:ankyrin repeat and death domain-containing protein 1B isoform X2 [Cyprinodon tularosa]|uniref:ankyrin repeat and death domain-containing protein 1B isoform X2 n=1 Tax=Cyprinodon tularosa TaxID=77115 RepID=UPI0018E206DE|nr:ankyrin repeat and death domain-containing protein 1B isoform X2 [Cyprinodon tularosa]